MSISTYDIKPKFQALLRPLLSQLRKMGLTPNDITLISFGICSVYALLLYQFQLSEKLLVVFPLIALMRMILNALDGMMATQFQMQTRQGAFLNEVCDVFSDVIWIFPFFFSEKINLLALVVCLIVGVLIEFVRIALYMAGGVQNFNGPFGKSDRALFFSIFACLLAMNVKFEVLNTFLALGIGLGICTLYNRCKSAKALENI